MGRIRITPQIFIDDGELREHFILSSGAGGQNVNKVASAVQLRFDVWGSASLPGDMKRRLAALAGRRMTKDGVLVITARQSRDQQRNRAEVRARLFDLIRRAAVVPKKRKATRPTKASKERRIEQKKARSRLKKLRARRLED